MEMKGEEQRRSGASRDEDKQGEGKEKERKGN